MARAVADGVLDNPVWASLTGPHAALASTNGKAARYPEEMSMFIGLDDPHDENAWAALAALVEPGGTVLLTQAGDVPAGWETRGFGDGVQMVGTSLEPAADPEAVTLGADDVPEMLDLVARTRPGPFLARTIEMGRYIGIRREGVLVAMAGERLHPPGWTEVSAVCTDEGYRGQGLGTRLVRAVAEGIRGRGEMPFLHAAATNTGAIRLYESIGFEHRLTTRFTVVRRV
ncbi:MAG: GNAT family N-acetyltransferase [Acidimicrobiales bacterium]